MSEPQTDYWKWKEKQGLPCSGTDVTDSINKIRPLNPVEEMLYIGASLEHFSRQQCKEDKSDDEQAKGL